MREPKLPRTDSIQELAEFWDVHDLTDFEDELEEVAEAVCVRSVTIDVALEPEKAEVGEPIARARGVSRDRPGRDCRAEETTRRER